MCPAKVLVELLLVIVLTMSVRCTFTKRYSNSSKIVQSRMVSTWVVSPVMYVSAHLRLVKQNNITRNRNLSEP